MGRVWSPLLVQGELVLASGPRPHTRALTQELAHFALRGGPGAVLWADGDHGFNPYDFAEMNLERGFDAEWGAERLLVKRCMTPFQWDTVLTRHLKEKLTALAASAAPAALVLAAPYEDLFSTDELQDWEREDYIEYSLAHLKGLAEEFDLPVVIAVDMARWCTVNPLMAWKAFEAADQRFAVRRSGEGWEAFEVSREVLAGGALAHLRQRTLTDFGGREVPSPTVRLVAQPARLDRTARAVAVERGR